MPDHRGWEIVRKLGEGGQGEVSLVRSPSRQTARENARKALAGLVHNITGIGGDVVGPRFFEAIAEYNRPDTPDELGALKRFKIPTSDREEEARAVGRLESEVHALQVLRHPAVIRLLDANVNDRFMVTEYHDLGTLHENLNRHKGDALASLRAFRKLVDGVAEIHRNGAIHLDIKPENIFITASGDLVLGDFGIVFFEDDTRLTKTYGERVGSHYWMAPWAYEDVRVQLSQVKAPLDIYPLGKVLWSMISGRNGFGFWEYKRAENDLEQIFPNDPSMPLVNSLLSGCVVREEKDCLPSVAELRSAVDELIELVSTYQRGFRPDSADTWPCRTCGRGRYLVASAPPGFDPNNPSMTAPLRIPTHVPGRTISDRAGFSVYICNHCGHAELFKAW